jgi:4-diphosphocytidyl-2-C-methyl-D-erythritol kinase
MMICFPNAKINLGLHVLNKGDDDFHQIETCLFPVPLFDVLEFKEASSFKYMQYGIYPEIPVHQNLLYKVWQLVNRLKSIPALEIHLLKNIPIGSGLGGGSSDASFFLKAINHYFDLKITVERLRGMASQIGSDCPFFIENKPSYAFGRGDKIENLGVSLKGKYILLIIPEIQISTTRAYSMVKSKLPIVQLNEIIKQPIESWKDNLTNDFETSVFNLYPNLRTIKSQLYKKGALYASLTGSGSVIFGIFDSIPAIKNAEFKYPHKLIQINIDTY